MYHVSTDMFARKIGMLHIFHPQITASKNPSQLEIVKETESIKSGRLCWSPSIPTSHAELKRCFDLSHSQHSLNAFIFFLVGVLFLKVCETLLVEILRVSRRLEKIL